MNVWRSFEVGATFAGSSSLSILYIIIFASAITPSFANIMTHALRNVVLERCNFFKECFFTYAQSLVTYITTDHRKRAAVAWTPSQHYRRSPRVLKPPAVPAYPLKRYFGWQRPIIQCNLRKPLLGLKALIRSHRQQTPENVNMVVRIVLNSARSRSLGRNGHP